jgi:hypothetical protein
MSNSHLKPVLRPVRLPSGRTIQASRLMNVVPKAAAGPSAGPTLAQPDLSRARNLGSRPMTGTGPEGIEIPAGYTHRSVLIDRGWSSQLISELLSDYMVPVEAPTGQSNKAYLDSQIAIAEATAPEIVEHFAARDAAAAALAAQVPPTGAIYDSRNTWGRGILMSRGWTAGHISRLLGGPDFTVPGQHNQAQHLWGQDRVATAEATDSKLIARLAKATAERTDKREGERAEREIQIAAVVSQGTNVFRKQAGVWVIEGTGLTTGQTVDVTKKDGGTEKRVTRSVTTTADGRQLATFGFVPDPPRVRTESTYTAPRQRSNGPCEDCGNWPASHFRHDSSGIGGMVCDRHADYPAEQLSFA